MNTINIIGQTFGRLKVINFEESRLVGKEGKKLSKRFYKVKCSCGNEKIVCKENLLSKTTTSCGCFAKEKAKERNLIARIPDNGSLWNLGFKNHLKDAKIRGYDTCLNINTYKEITSKNCYYCGVSGKKHTHKNLSGEIFRNGIDRIDSSKPYTLDNIRPCCGICNYMKLTMTEKEFFSHIEKIYTRMSNYK